MAKPTRSRWLIALLAVGLGLAAAWRWQQSRPAPVTSIQDGKTIDFSSGQSVVRDDAADRAALEKAKREIDEATADITFAPTKPEKSTESKH